MKSLIIQRYANREVRIGLQDLPSRHNRGGDGAAQRNKDRESKLLEVEVERKAIASGGFTYRDKDGIGYIRTTEGYERTETYLQQQLDITYKVQRSQRANEHERHNAPCNRIRAGKFTRNARHRILEAGSVIDEWGAGAGKALMVTLTLPGSSDGAFAVLASYSGYIANRILQPIRRAGADTQWFYVWELQKRGALHMHLCLWNAREAKSVAISIDIVSTWYRALQELSQRTGIDLFCNRSGDGCTLSRHWQFDIQMCKRSVAAYFSKYASKGANEKGQPGALGSKHAGYLPKRWWGMSRTLTREIESRRLKVEIYGVSEQQGTEMLCAISGVLERHNPVRRYGYNFEVSRRERGVQRILGWGLREIFYFSDTDFREVSDVLPGLAISVSQYCSNAVIHCNHVASLHTCTDYRSMQRTGVDKVEWVR